MLRWGIIGCGDVVLRKSGPAIQTAGRSRIIAVMRRNVAKATAFAERYDVQFCTDRAELVTGNPEVDIVYVATPPCVHEQYVLAAARAGKHVLVEKPMGLNADEARRMIAACDEAGRELFVSYYRRFQPHIIAMHNLLREGRIGRPVQAFLDLAKPVEYGRPGGWREEPALGGGGHFVDVGCHRLDLMVHFLGEVEEANGYATRLVPTCRVEQVVTLCVRFASGAQLAAMGDYYSGRRADLLRIIGTEGELLMDSLDSYAFTLRTGAGEERFAFDEAEKHHLGLIRHIESVLLDGKPNRCAGRVGLTTEVILDRAVRRWLRDF